MQYRRSADDVVSPSDHEACEVQSSGRRPDLDNEKSHIDDHDALY